jgi:hypothetical protein
MKNIFKAKIDRYLIVVVGMNTIIMGYEIFTHRYKGLLDIDESGYSIMAIKNWNSFSDGGLIELFQNAMTQPLHAPIQPLLASFLYVFFGPRLILNFIIPFLSFVGISILLFKFFEKYNLKLVAFSGAIAITSLSAVRDYASTFNFAEITTFFILLYLYAMNRFDKKITINLFLGIILAFVFLTRTVSIIYVVSLVTSYLVVQLIRRKSPSLIAKELVLQIFVFSIAILPWLYKNSSLLQTYFLNFGYGNRAREYGEFTSVISVSDWKNFLIKVFLMQQNFLSLLIFTIGIILVLKKLIEKSIIYIKNQQMVFNERNIEIVSWIVVFCVTSIILMTSPNKGSGFDLALIILMPMIIFQMIGLGSYKIISVIIFILSLTIAVGQTINLFVPVNLNITTWGFKTPIVKQTTIIEEYLNYGLIDREIDPTKDYQFPYLLTGKDENQSWNKSNLEIIRFLESHHIDSQFVHLGFRHILINPNSINLIRNYEKKNDIPIKFLPAFELQRKNEQETTKILDDNSFFESCTILLAKGKINEILPYVEQDKLESQILNRGYVVVEKSIILPDSRSIQIFINPRVCIHYNSNVEVRS